MKIRTRRRVIMMLPIVFGICILSIQQWTTQRVGNVLNADDYVNEVVMGTYVLHRLLVDIEKYPAEQRPRQQWQSQMRSLHELLQWTVPVDGDLAELLPTLQQKHQLLEQNYSDFCPECIDGGALPTWINQRQHRLLERMTVLIHEIESGTVQLAQLSNMHVEAIRSEEQQIIRWVVLLLVLVLTSAVYIVSEYIISHITMLKTGSERFGSGDLDHRLALSGDDEISDLARSFDQMAERLQQSFIAQERLNAQTETLNHELEQRTVRLQESEEKFRNITDSAQDAIILLDTVGVIRYWNRAAERIFGYPRDVALGKNLHQLIVPTRYHQSQQGGWQHFSKTGEGAVVGNLLEVTALRQDGSEFPVELSISSIKLQGQWQAVALIRDISERKENERIINESNTQIEQAHREWVEAFDSVKDPIFLHDAEGRIMRANRAYAEQAGLSFKEIVGRPYWECFPKGEGPLHSCSLVTESSDVEEFNDEFTLENGDSYLSRGFAIREEDGSYRYSIHIMENTTFQLQAEQMLKESESRFRDLFEEAPLPYQSLDQEGRVLEVNQAWEELFGYGRKDVIGQPFEEYLSSSSRDQFHNGCHMCAELQDEKATELEICCRDGSERIISTRGRFSYDLSGKVTASHCILTDITERKRTEASLLLKDQVFESSLSAISTADINGVLTTVNRAFLKIWGYERAEEVLGRPIPEFMVYEYEAKAITLTLNTKGKWEGEYAALRKDGSTFDAYGLATILKDAAGNFTGYQSSVLDISERKRAEEAVEQHSYNLNERVKEITALYKVTDLLAKPEMALDEAAATIVKTLPLGWRYPDAASARVVIDKHSYHCEQLVETEYQQKAPIFVSGERRGEVSIFYPPGAGGEDEPTFLKEEENLINTVALEIGHFIERTEDEHHLLSLNQMLQTSRDCNEVLVRATEEKVLIQQVCDILAAHGEFSLVWAGLSGQEGTVGHTTTAASSDSCAAIEKLTGLNTDWQDEDGPCPAREAIRSGQVQIIHDFDRDGTYSAYRHKIADLGCLSLAALPLQNQGKSLGVLMVYSDQTGVFNHQQSDMLEELSNDLAYGINTLRVHRERDQMGERIERNLLQTVEAISHTLEIRDPYTAGHQRRVTELSVAIAEEMGLDEQQIEGIRFGSTIHDIGKIHVPAEILNRPGRLSEMEFGIIKTHPQVGYDIIKDVDFPWPVADIIHQHHERLDGSGYPDGLKGDEIIVEARIVAVADVIEAMSSHRPYRPGLGIERALEEITKNRGKYYDPHVVDICIDLFSSNRFSFSDFNQ